MGSSGLEPPTSRLSGARSNLLSYEPTRGFLPLPLLAIGTVFLSFTDGDDGIRTHDPLLAGQVLSQLSYTPMLVPIVLTSFLSFNDPLSLPSHGSLKIEQQATFLTPI